jgi:hypothetical protein
MSNTIVGRLAGRWSLAIALAGGFTACAEPTSPDRTPKADAPSPDLASTSGRAGPGLDAEFGRLAKQIPGFGGMYVDRSGKLNVYVKPPAAGARQAPVDAVRQLRTLGSPRIQSRLGQAGAAVTTLAAKYDFSQLQAFKDKAHAAFKVKGVVYTDIDEASNRVRVAIAPAASQPAVERALANAGVPREAVLISRASPISPLKTLQERIRPVPGAAQIEFLAPDIDPRFVFICTLGFNAKIPSQPNRNFFVTASHCSDIQGGNQHTDYNQPEIRNNPAVDRIATEFKDPGYGDPGGLCFQGFRCRLSDALLARYNTTTQTAQGKIARTTFMLNRIGSIEIDPQHPRWNIVTEFGFPFLGETAHKVGRSSGWTAGPVIATCVDVGQTGSNIIKLCQDIVLAGVRGGDSGAPIFEQLGGNQVALVGLLWGGGTNEFGATVFVFSSMENIEFELGPLTTEVP